MTQICMLKTIILTTSGIRHLDPQQEAALLHLQALHHQTVDIPMAFLFHLVHLSDAMVLATPMDIHHQNPSIL